MILLRLLSWPPFRKHERDLLDGVRYNMPLNDGDFTLEAIRR